MPKRKNNAVNNNSSLNDQLSSLYRNPSFPGAFSSKEVFFKHAKKKFLLLLENISIIGKKTIFWLQKELVQKKLKYVAR